MLGAERLVSHPGEAGISPGEDGISPGEDGISPGEDGISPGEAGRLGREWVRPFLLCGLLLD